MLTALITATVAFAATNLDDIFILTLFFSQTRNAKPVVLCQYLGFSALVVISMIGFVAGRLLPPEWIGLCGLLPIAIGIKKALKRDGENGSTAGTGVASVALVTFANGGDNLGVYAPLFATFEPSELLVILLVFYVLLGVWCLLGYLVTTHPLVSSILRRYGYWIVPFVLIGLGIYILFSSGSVHLFC